MTPQSQSQNSAFGSGVNFDVREQEFGGNEFGIPIGGRFEYPNGSIGNAIGEFVIAPTNGTYVLGVIEGKIQWIPTDSCD